MTAVRAMGGILLNKAALTIFLAMCLLGATIGYAARPPGSPAPVRRLAADITIMNGATLPVVEPGGVHADIRRMRGQATVRERFTVYGHKVTRSLDYRDGKIRSVGGLTVNGKKPESASLLFTDGRRLNLAARVTASRLRVERPVSFSLIAGGAIVFLILLAAGTGRVLRRRSGL